MVSVVHGFVSAITDDPSAATAGKVLPSHWNAGHTITMAATSRVAGRKTAGAGAIEELTVADILNFLSTTQGDIPIRGASTWGTTQLDPVPTGSILPYGGTSAPTNYLFCDGAAVSRSTYAALFAVLGTTYGAGDGSTTFNVPDLRGRFPLGQDDMGGSAAGRVTSGGSGVAGATLGATGGTQNKTLTTTELPAHTHTGTTGTESVNHTHTFSGTTSSDGAHTHDVNKNNGSGSATVTAASGLNSSVSQTSPTTSAGAHTHTFSGTTSTVSANHTHSFTTSSSGSGSAFGIMNPCQVVNYIIKV